MRILVTGSGGFIGGSFGRHAHRAGHEVLGLGRRSQSDRDWPGRYLQTDVAQSDLREILVAFAPDLVFHGAGTASVGGSIKAPLDDLRAALLTWANLLDAVRRSGVRPRIVFPSSAAVYGNPSSLPVAEDAPVAPISPYGFHKAACELLAREYADCFGLRVLVGRLFSVFGPAQRRLLVWELYEQASGPGPDICLQGTGAETRDYLHVDDVASAVLELSSRLPAPDAGVCHVLNLASGRETRVADVAERIRQLIAPAKPLRCRGLQRPGDPTRWLADIGALLKLLPAWRPGSLSDGLQQCSDAWGRQRPPLAAIGSR